MIGEKSIHFLKKLAFSFALVIGFAACENFDAPGAYFDSYGNVAKITNVLYSRALTEANGVYNIDSSDDLTITYLIDNPGDFAFWNTYGSYQGITTEVCKNYIKRTISKDYLARYDGSCYRDSSGAYHYQSVSTNFSLMAFLPNGKAALQDNYSGFEIYCNSAPPKITNAMGQMYSDASSGVTERLVIALQIPHPTVGYTWESSDGQTYNSYNYDYEALVVTDTRTGTVREFPFEYSYIPSTEVNGWSISSYISSYYLEPTCPNGPSFTYNYEEGSPFYIVTDVDNLTSVDLFTIKLEIRDRAGLKSEVEIPSHAIMLSPPTCNTSVASVTNTFDCPYYEFTINAPANAADATLHYSVVDASGNPVAATNGSATEAVGSATFNLYPNADGSAKTYTISQAYASKTGYVDSENAASSFASSGSLSVSGVALEEPVSSLVSGNSYPQETVCKWTNPQGGSVYWTYSVSTGSGFETGDDPSPASITLEAAGDYIFSAYAHKEYYANSSITNASYTVNCTVAYVRSDGSDSDLGTKEYPFQTISHAITSFTSPTDSANTVYILDDMTSINGLTPISGSYC
ncbi:MAG: hypothetical protein K6A42_09645, partial [Treponema sp.]|nr:hypothetical protein [Treponema sp.]